MATQSARDQWSVRDQWAWLSTGHMDMAIPKMEEYGSADLVDIGRELLTLSGGAHYDQALCYETGVYFYLRGKVARWLAAVERGVPVSDDTLDDIIVYATMVRLDRLKGREE